MLDYTIDDPISGEAASCVEVTFDFGDRMRWLIFVTPQQLTTNGGVVDGTQVRFHLGERHIIVVSELSETIIDKVLRQLHASGELMNRTIPLV